MKAIVAIIFSIILLTGCSKKKETPVKVSFYHWKSTFNLTANETEALSNNHCSDLYLKYFDIVNEDGIKPVSVIQFIHKPKQKIVPVIFIKNNVFAGSDSLFVDSLAFKTHRLINEINAENKLTTGEIQFDCDWTEKTRQAYFHFLRKYKSLSKQIISATIRLHQVKYSITTGIPPADKGVLMYYNIGSINAGEKNSIYERSNAIKYIAYLRNYNLKLDVALPIFGWGIQSNGGKVINLLNKTSEADFLNDTNFVKQTNGIFKTRNACFKNAYYFAKDDEIKFEFVLPQQIEEMTADMVRCLKNRPSQILFYDLDEINLKRYDKEIYKKMADSFN